MQEGKGREPEVYGRSGLVYTIAGSCSGLTAAPPPLMLPLLLCSVFPFPSCACAAVCCCCGEAGVSACESRFTLPSLLVSLTLTLPHLNHLPLLLLLLLLLLS